MTWENLVGWLILIAVIALIVVARKAAQRKAARFRQEGRQEAVAALSAVMQTGNQSVSVYADGSNRVVDERAAVRAEYHEHNVDHGRVPAELGRGVRPVGPGRNGRVVLSRAALARRSAAHDAGDRDGVGPMMLGPDDDAASRIVRGGDRPVTGDCDGCPVPSDGCSGLCPARAGAKSRVQQWWGSE